MVAALLFWGVILVAWGVSVFSSLAVSALVFHTPSRLEEAVRQYDCALRLAPAVAAIYANKAAALSALGRAAEAIVALERALSHDPSYGNADRQLASLLSKSAATGYSPTIETALQRCFDSPRVDYVALARPAAQQILSKYGLE